jgi:hypothetical protein
MNTLNTEAPAKNGYELLVASAILTVVLWHIPFGNYIMYPFTIFGTWIHELGHGLMAILMGGNFEKLEVFQNGSGLATYSYYEGSLFLGKRIGISMIAAAGLVAPPVVGAIFILMARSSRGALLALYILLGFMVLSTLLWVRNGFGLIAVPALAGVVFVMAHYTQGGHRQFFAQFVGVQSALATFMNWRYLFTPTANVGSAGVSDTGAIAAQLWLPYWFWGAAIALFSMVIILWSLRRAYPKTS